MCFKILTYKTLRPNQNSYVNHEMRSTVLDKQKHFTQLVKASLIN